MVLDGGCHWQDPLHCPWPSAERAALLPRLGHTDQKHTERGEGPRRGHRDVRTCMRQVFRSTTRALAEAPRGFTLKGYHQVATAQRRVQKLVLLFVCGPVTLVTVVMGVQIQVQKIRI